jgi:cell division protein FtsB
MFRLSVFILLLLLSFTGKEIIKLYNLERELYETLNKNDNLVEHNKKLKEEINRLNNKDYMKRAIKEELGFIEDGENIYYFIKEEDDDKQERNIN